MTRKAADPGPTATTTRDEDEAEYRRWTPEEVIELQLLPYRSVRVLKRLCYRRAIHHHLDGGRITFTPEDLRRENERTAVVPFAKA
ncbi:hypothetical protein ACFWWC_03775 [Streptomyces sp. NPDC058642]|uniref:hypothetical protein n=1 Tax=Streptomyces sp. NPDC058642 TaxID=3346572 RepID=UPI0036647F68